MELFKIFGKIAVDNSEANKALKETSSNAKDTAEALGDTSSSGEKSGGKLGSAFKKIGSGALAVGKAVGAGMVAAGAAVAGLATKAIQSYANYEQLVGGVETLFKESADIVQGYAKDAYKTAGLSANEYMETVTSFSASLLQSLDGDTKAAAEKANVAITDMSDNANKMGTDMSLIQNAYQGFAKQNYTMLDNLKLGYGGTKEEMERLLADAEKLSGQKFDISSYADVVDAIHVIQTEMGITGTTAKEASSTISGSISSMKSSWQNLLTAISSDDLPFGDYVDSFVESVSTVASNLLPRIEIALNGVVQLVDKLAPVLISKIPDLLSSLLPTVITSAVNLLNSIVSALPSLIDMLVNSVLPQLVSGVVSVANAIISALPSVMQSICSALPSLIPMLINGIVSIIVTLCTNFSKIIQPIIDVLPELIVVVVNTLLSNLPALIGGVVQLVVGLVRALPQILSGLWSALVTLCKQAVSGLFNKIGEWIRQLFPKSADNIFKVLDTIKSAFKTWISNIKAIFSVVFSVISTPFKLAWNGIKTVWNNVVAYFKMIWNNIKAVFAVVDSVLSGDFKGAWDGIKKIWSNVTGFFKQVVSNVKNAFSNVGEILTAPFRKGKDAIKKIVDNIKGFFTGLKLNFPKIKLPHFGISPSGWKVGDLLKGSIPKLSIDWYAKAMNNPMVMTQPTVFGYNSATGHLMGGGEAGSEVVSGTNTLMNMIQRAVSDQNSGLVYYLQRLHEILAEYFPQVLAAMDRDIVLDSGAMVGAMAVPMNQALGKLSSRKDRGR